MIIPLFHNLNALQANCLSSCCTCSKTKCTEQSDLSLMGRLSAKTREGFISDNTIVIG